MFLPGFSLKKFLRLAAALLILILPAAGALVWLPTGPWLALPLVRHLGVKLAPSLRLEGLEGSLYNGYTATGAALVSGDTPLLELRRLAVRPDWSAILSGTPWLESLELEGLSSDVANLQALAESFGLGFRDGETAPEPVRIQPLRVSVQDVTLASPQGTLHLASLDLSKEGVLSLRSTAAGLPLDADALITFSPLQAVSSDLRFGRGRGSVKGRLEPPFNLHGDLTGLSLESLLPLLSNSNSKLSDPKLSDPGLRGSGRLDARFTVKGTPAAPEADGVLSLTRARIRDVPVELRLPWNWSGQRLTVRDAAFRSLSADVTLTLSADLRGGLPNLQVTAKGSAQNLSLKNIGRLLAPQAALAGEGGRVRFDLTADAAGNVSGDLTASLPEVAMGGKRLVRNLTADVRLTPGGVPRIVCGGEVFGGRLQGRGEAMRKGKGQEKTLRPEMVFTAANLDAALIAAAFPALAPAAPSGKLTLDVRVDETLAVSGSLNSAGLKAGGVAVRDLKASLRYAGGQAVLERLEGFIGRAPFSLSGTADLRRSTLGFEGSLRGLDPKFIPQIASQVQGARGLKLFAGGTFSAPRVTVHVTGRENRVAALPLRGLKLSATYAEGRLTVPETVLNLPGGALTFQGTVDLPPGAGPRLNLSGSLRGLNLSVFSKALKLKQPLEGTVQGDLKLAGSAGLGPHTLLSASLRGTSLKAGDFSVSKFDLDVRGTPKEVRVERLSASVGKGTIEGKGTLALEAKKIENNRIALDLVVKGVELRPLLSSFITEAPVGGILSGALTLRGVLAKPEVTLRVDSPLTVRETLVDNLALSVQNSGKDRFALHASGKLGDFQVACQGDIRREGNGWRYSLTTDALDLNRMLAAKSPSLRGLLDGQVTAKLTGSTRKGKDGAVPVAVFLSIPKLTASGLTVTDILLPLQISGNTAHLSGGRAVLCKGTVRANAEVDLAESTWQGTASAAGLDLGNLARPFLPEGELVGSADANVRVKGNFGTLMMVFVNGGFTTGPGYLHKVKAVEAVSPIQRITFETIRGTFFWDGSDLWLNPGTQATAGKGDPLYRYFSANGPLGIPGKGLRLLCKGRFDVPLLDKVLGALKGVFQYFTGGLSGGGGLLKGVVGKALGIEKRDFQDVSFALTGSWADLQLLHLRIDKPLQDYLPLEKLNKTEEQKASDKKFRLNLKFPTGPGAKDSEGRTEDQFKEQLLDNLLNLGD